MMNAPAFELSLPETAIPGARAVMGRAGGENFPVAARVLARRHRRGLLAVYGFARLADELGDEVEGDRLAALDWLEDELEDAYEGRARHPLMRALQEVLAEHRLPRAPFMRLIEANRVDQRVSHYETWDQLAEYCELSANPVGELVLAVFEQATPERVALSDRVCTALQLIEHVQDLGEDLARGRSYLPAEDLARFPRTGAGLREVVAFEMARARELLAAGPTLVASVSGRAKLAVAAFVAGGATMVGEIERAGWEVLGGVPRASAWRRTVAVGGVLWRARRPLATGASGGQ